MRKDLFVYLSGPITANAQRSSEEHVAAAVKVYLQLVTLGVPAFCPHLSAAFPTAFSIPYDRWLAYDCAVIDRCTHVLMLAAWRNSKGACLERDYALLNGKPVVYSVEELLDVGRDTQVAEMEMRST